MGIHHSIGRATLLVSATALLTLGGCGKADKTEAPAGGNTMGDSTMSTAEVAKEVTKVKLQAGEWEMTHEITDAQIANAPEGMPAGAMQAMIGKKTVIKQCITPQQAENPGAEMMAGQKDAKCTYADFDMSGGTVSGSMSCSGGPDGSATMAMKLAGTYTPTSYDMTVEMRTTGGMGDGARNMEMTMTSRGRGKRIGECPANR